MQNGSGEPYDFARLGEEIAAAMLQAAEAQVNEAQNLLAEVRVLAEGLHQQVDNKNREINDLRDRLKTFGEGVLAAHRKFNGTAETQLTGD